MYEGGYRYLGGYERPGFTGRIISIQVIFNRTVALMMNSAGNVYRSFHV